MPSEPRPRRRRGKPNHALFCQPALLAALLASLPLAAEPPPDYYAATAGQSGEALRTVLHQIIRNHTIIPYSSGSLTDTSDALRLLDADPVIPGNVVLVYARRSQSGTTFGASSGWNREHLWPNSYGLDDVEPAYSDLHNLRAADIDVNAARANLWFDASDPSEGGYRQPAHAEAAQTSMDVNSWEPPPEVRGDIARALFYMDVRYEGDTGREPQLRLTDDLPRIDRNAAYMGRLSTLLRWHELDPVDSREALRNDRVFTVYQHNRNPFVDHPEWVRSLFWPQLRVDLQASQLRFTWSADFVDATVERATAAFGVWQPVDETPVRQGEEMEVTLPRPTASAFFRLSLP